MADVSATVKKDVKDKFAKWEKRFKVDLTGEARESWSNQMVELADKLIKVAIKNPEAFQADEAA